MIDDKVKCWGGGDVRKIRARKNLQQLNVPVDVLGERTDWKTFHYADDAENFDTNFLLNPDDETQYSASGPCLDDGSDVYISGDVEDDSQILVL